MRNYLIGLTLGLILSLTTGQIAYSTDGQYPDPPTVRIDYRNSSDPGGWAEPAQRAPRLEVKERVEYPDPPKVRVNYRSSPDPGGWGEDTPGRTGKNR